MMRWTNYRRRSPEGDFEAVWKSGPWTITKEFYADGPTMFEWILTTVHDRTLYETFGTLKAAKANAEQRQLKGT